MLSILIAITPLGCEKEDKECKCDECPCEIIRDAEPEMEGGEQSDMGLEQEGGSEEEQPEEEEGGAEQEELEGGDQDAGEEVVECEEEADC